MCGLCHRQLRFLGRLYTLGLRLLWLGLKLGGLVGPILRASLSIRGLLLSQERRAYASVIHVDLTSLAHLLAHWNHVLGRGERVLIHLGRASGNHKLASFLRA